MQDVRLSQMFSSGIRALCTVSLDADVAAVADVLCRCWSRRMAAAAHEGLSAFAVLQFLEDP